MREEKAGKSAAKLRYRGVDIRGTRGGDGLIARLKRVERRADAADIRRTAKTEDLLDHGVHVALPGAHLVNDVAAGVLNVARGENAAAADKSEDTLVELRHGGVRTADAADRTLADVAEGGFLPETEIRLKENLVHLRKRGRILKASYEAIRFQRLDLFAVALRQIAYSS